MRLLETVRLPDPTSNFPFSNNYVNVTWNGFLATVTIGSVNFNSGNNSAPAFLTRFGQARLGRIWSIDRLAITFTEFINVSYTDLSNALNQFALNLQVFQNDMPVGPIKSIIYDISTDSSTTPNLDITAQNGPINYDFYSSVVMGSGDNLRADLTLGLATALGCADSMSLKFKAALQLVGNNDTA